MKEDMKAKQIDLGFVSGLGEIHLLSRLPWPYLSAPKIEIFLPTLTVLKKGLPYSFGTILPRSIFNLSR